MTRAQRLVLMAFGAAAFGGIVYGIAQKRQAKGIRPLGPPACDVVEDKGGVVAGVRYLERRSKGAQSDAALPMVIVFHSRGATPEGFSGFHHNVKGPVRVITPAGFERLGGGRSWFGLPARTQDQAELAEQMAEAGAKMARFIADIVRCRPTAGWPVVTGSSQGGSMAYLMANQYPQFVHGAVAVAGWLPKPLWNRHMAPTIGLHGTDDRTVPYLQTARFAEDMQRAGAPLEFHSYPSGHSMSKDMLGSWHRFANEMLGYA